MTKLDEIQSCMTEMRDDVRKITEVLAGDEYGNPGLVKDHKDLKERFYKLREDVRKIKIIGGVLASILTFFITIAHHIKGFFE